MIRRLVSLETSLSIALTNIIVFIPCFDILLQSLRK
jgi:hypothetical protein